MTFHKNGEYIQRVFTFHLTYTVHRYIEKGIVDVSQGKGFTVRGIERALTFFR